jgi:hypothetical protein
MKKPSDDVANPWPELVMAAQHQISLIEAGDSLAAKKALRMAAIGLAHVLNGNKPDPEHAVYLAFLLQSLNQFLEGVRLDKAFGLWTTNRPRAISDGRNMVLFMRVGRKVDALRKKSTENPISKAIGLIAKEAKITIQTARKAWQAYGAERGWRVARGVEPKGK